MYLIGNSTRFSLRNVPILLGFTDAKPILGGARALRVEVAVAVVVVVVVVDIVRLEGCLFPNKRTKSQNGLLFGKVYES